MVPDASTTKRSHEGPLLVRGVNWLGDAVMTLPALRRLRERFPDRPITALTPQNLADLWQGHPDVDSVITLQEGESPRTVARRLRAGHFDLALILPNSPRSALESWLARIPNRVGYEGRWRRWLLTRPVPFPNDLSQAHKRSVAEIKRLIRGGGEFEARPASPRVHQIHTYLRLAAVLGCDPLPVAPKLQISRREIDSIAAGFPDLHELLNRSRETQPPAIIGLNVSAAYGPAKRWPLDRFAGVVTQVSSRHKTSTWLNFGGASDWEMGEQLKRAAEGRVINLAGKTSLRQLMALLKMCDAVVTNDSGPMHLAAALGSTVIVPFGSTSAELTGPGLPGEGRHRVLQSATACAPCFRRTCPIDFRCMTGISVEAVAAAVLGALPKG